MDAAFKTMLILLLFCAANYLSALSKRNYEMIMKNRELMEEIKFLVEEKSNDFEFGFPQHEPSWTDK